MSEGHIRYPTLIGLWQHDRVWIVKILGCILMVHKIRMTLTDEKKKPSWQNELTSTTKLCPLA